MDGSLFARVPRCLTALALLGSALVLPGCPLSDDYFVDSGVGGAGVAGADGEAGESGRAGACGTTACTEGWQPMAPPPAAFVARERAAAVSFDRKVFIFGGLDRANQVLNSAAIYDPATDSWKLVAIQAATPSPRQLATAVWTGSAVLVFGGRDAGTTYLADGAAYDPATDRWSSIRAAARPRAGATGGASATTAVFGGGLTFGSAAVVGVERYDATTDTWSPPAGGIQPTALLGATWVFTGRGMLLYGGAEQGFGNTDYSDDTYEYSLASNKWSELPTGPSARSGAFSAWAGGRMFVWGGRDDSGGRSDGAVLEASTWAGLSEASAPSPRWITARQSGWAFALGAERIAILGGVANSGEIQRDGGVYDGKSGWTAIPAWTSSEMHSYGVAVYTGREIVVWGGVHGTNPTATGERWTP